MSIHHVYIFVTNLPETVKWSSVAYIHALLAYNIHGSYVDAKMYLTKFRTNELNEQEIKEINDDWSAVKYGANSNFVGRLFDSIVWPITLTKSIIPSIVLYFNPPTKTD